MKPNHDAEKVRRRERTEMGRSPAQKTPRSENKARSYRYPGKGNRAAQSRREVASYA